MRNLVQVMKYIVAKIGCSPDDVHPVIVDPRPFDATWTAPNPNKEIGGELYFDEQGETVGLRDKNGNDFHPMRVAAFGLLGTILSALDIRSPRSEKVSMRHVWPPANITGFGQPLDKAPTIPDTDRGVLEYLDALTDAMAEDFYTTSNERELNLKVHEAFKTICSIVGQAIARPQAAAHGAGEFQFETPPPADYMQDLIKRFGKAPSDWARIAMEHIGINKTHTAKYLILTAYFEACVEANKRDYAGRAAKADEAFFKSLDELEALIEYKYPDAPKSEHFVETAVRMLKYYDGMAPSALAQLARGDVKSVANQRLGRVPRDPDTAPTPSVPQVDQGFDRLRRMGTDAEKWRDEFASIFGGTLYRRADPSASINTAETLFGWFANAIQAGISEGEQRGVARATEDLKGRVATAFKDGEQQGQLSGFEAGYERGYNTAVAHVSNHLASRRSTLGHDAKSHAHAFVGGGAPMVAVDDVAKG